MAQVICKTCGTVGEREEAFHHIPLDVKVNNNIQDAFSQFVNGETISDYKCVVPICTPTARWQWGGVLCRLLWDGSWGRAGY